MRKWIVLAVAALGLLAGYVAAGPYLAIRGIHESLRTRELGRLERHVDFPALRRNLRAQVEDRLARETGGSLLGDLARGAVGQVSGYAVDAMVSPQGIAVLLEGRALARRASARPAETAGGGSPAGYQPLEQAETRFESPSRFTATTRGAAGDPVVFVFQRQGLRWRLTDIRLPGSDPARSASPAP